MTRVRPLPLLVVAVVGCLAAPPGSGGAVAVSGGAVHPPVIRLAEIHDEQAVRATLSALAAGPFGVPGGVRAASPPAYPYSSVGNVVPDLTGDGLDDVLQVVVMGERRFAAREGRTGRALWSLPAADLFYPRSAGRGRGQPAALVAQTAAFDPVTGLVETGLVSLDGATGRELWRVGGPGYPWAGTYLVGTSPRADRPDAVLALGVTTSGLPGAPGAAVPLVLDAATGLPLHQGEPLLLTGGVGMTGTPDLDADGVDDYAVVTTDEATTVTARSGATGRPLWSTSSPGSGGYLVALPGRGRPVVQLVEGRDDLRTVLTGFDGLTGRHRWTRLLDGLAELGDADGDGTADVLSTRIDYRAGEVRLTGISALSGRTLWSRTVKEPAERGTEWLPLPQAAGDVDGDGAQDVLVRMIELPRWVERHQVVVAGHDGASRKRTDLLGAPLHGSLRAGRDALLALDGKGRAARLAATDLAGRLWMLPLALEGVAGLTHPQTGALRRTGRQDVLVTAYGGGSTWLLALDGRTGAQLWRLDLSR